ncbi:Nodulin MtN21 /EamA-like transporter family protein [Forsythia ovata]|uniref:Nodulin MtN21 /EamA-like transporter family protein n=1 Tax=Forsythia ovata TaxID=205694 RepID=A0ABD1WRS9_9LAMI
MARGGGNRNCYKDVLPFTALVVMECSNVGLNTLFKFATNHGMSQYVFVVYAYAVAALVLLPARFFCDRSRELPPLNFSIMIKVFLLGSHWVYISDHGLYWNQLWITNACFSHQQPDAGFHFRACYHFQDGKASSVEQ